MQRVRAMALAMCLMLTALAIPAMAWNRDDLPVLASGDAAGSGAFGVKLTTTSTGDIALEMNVNGPQAASVFSAGIAVTDAAGVASFAFVFTGVTSPDRNFGLPVMTSGPVPAGLDIRITTPQNKGQAGTDAACNFLCVGVTDTGKAAGSYHYVLWGGGGSSVHFEAKASSGSAVVSRGSAGVAGDYEIRNGDTNMQYQSGGVGAKVMKGAFVPFSAGQRVYGLWQTIDFKFACAAVCFLPVQSLNGGASLLCNIALGQGCGTAVISYSGPSAGHGSTTYFLLNAPAGDYRFTVDQKVDAYETLAQPIGCFGVCVGAILLENYDIFSMASVTVPA